MSRKSRGRTQQVEAWVDVDLADFDDDVILEYADELRAEQLARRHGKGQVTGGLDYGALTISFGSWEAMKLREAVANSQAYEALDILRRALGDRVAA